MHLNATTLAWATCYLTASVEPLKIGPRPIGFPLKSKAGCLCAYDFAISKQTSRSVECGRTHPKVPRVFFRYIFSVWKGNKKGKMVKVYIEENQPNVVEILQYLLISFLKSVSSWEETVLSGEYSSCKNGQRMAYGSVNSIIHQRTRILPGSLS